MVGADGGPTTELFTDFSTVTAPDVRRGVSAAPDMDEHLGEQYAGVHAGLHTRYSVTWERSLCGIAAGLAQRRAPLLMLACLLPMVDAAPRESVQAQLLSVTYPRASLFEGLPAWLVDQADAVLDNRLSASSMRTVRSALVYWQQVCEREGWSEILMTDDPERGGRLVAFVLHMVADTDLVADTITGYVWGLRNWMKLQHQADPVMGVMGWHDFMMGVRVLAHVPAEPRRQVPFQTMLDMATVVDLRCFHEVQSFFLDLILMYTFSRTECPCPKSYSGDTGFDKEQHWCVRDIKFALVAGVWVLCVRFKKIKQDPRVERPGARGDGSDPGASQRGGSDWVYIGDVPGSPLSPFLWYRRLMAFYDGPRPAEAPFFMARDRVRPYTYNNALTDFKDLLVKAGCLLVLGLHGLRVLGYNLALGGAGEAIAVVQGGWKLGSNTRYHRFNLARDIFTLPGRMVAHGNGEGPAEDSESDDDVVLPTRRDPSGRVSRDSLRRPSEARASAPDGGQELGVVTQIHPLGTTAVPGQEMGTVLHIHPVSASGSSSTREGALGQAMGSGAHSHPVGAHGHSVDSGEVEGQGMGSVAHTHPAEAEGSTALVPVGDTTLVVAPHSAPARLAPAPIFTSPLRGFSFPAMANNTALASRLWSPPPRPAPTIEDLLGPSFP